MLKRYTDSEGKYYWADDGKEETKVIKQEVKKEELPEIEKAIKEIEKPKKKKKKSKK